MEDTPETASDSPKETPSDTIDVAEDPVAIAAAEALRVKKLRTTITPEMRADPVSRKLMRLSLFFASLALICLGLLTLIYYQKKNAGHSAVVETSSAKIMPVISHTLQEIHVKLKNEQDLRAEINVECSSKETCEFIKANPAQARDLLIPILSSIESDSFSNFENKNMIRKKLADRLNSLELPGKVNQVHFNNLSIEGQPE